MRAPRSEQAVGMPEATASLGPHTVQRMGFGAMQLPGRGVMGPPRDRDAALAVLRRARELGVDHVDTASYYGPDVANELIREALRGPDGYPDDLRIVSKVGARRDEKGGWISALAPGDVRAQVDADLRVLETDHLTAVNLRLPDGDEAEGLLEPALETLVELRDEGKLELIGLSNAGAADLDAARALAPIAEVQNQYGLLDRGGEDVLTACTEGGIAFVPFFPLGSAFGVAPRPADDPEVRRIAAERGATPAQVALAWLLHHAPTILLIPGTGSLEHLEENVAARDLELGDDDLATLDGLAGARAA
jgi:pyridoxine 4-dehydrogenase